MYTTFIRIFYNAALLLLLLLGSPWWLLRYAFSDRFREGLRQRFFGPAGSFPDMPRIWIHAVSVGEVLAISRLVRELAERAPDYAVVISTTTRTGQALARERFGAERCFYFPLDFPWSIGAAMRRIRPSMLILAESELWPNVLTACNRNKVPVTIVNARVSDRSFPRYMRLRALWRPFLQVISLVLAQSREDAWRLQQIGIPSERIKVGGNLKFDIQASRTTPLSSLFLEHLAVQAKLIVCGSTLEGEEALLLEAWPHILAAEPDAVLLLAPRHPERFGRVAALLHTASASWYKRSEWVANPSALAAGSVFLLDSIGELASLYSLARVAFIGGSLVPAGGHNPLEAAQFAVPITIGPHYENFRDMVELLRANEGIKVLSAASLSLDLTTLLGDQNLSIRMGQNAQQVFRSENGSTRRTADAILALAEGSRR